MIVRPCGTFNFCMDLIVLVALTWLSIPLASLTTLLPTDFHHVSLFMPTNNVSIVYFSLAYCIYGKRAVGLTYVVPQYYGRLGHVSWC